MKCTAIFIGFCVLATAAGATTVTNEQTSPLAAAATAGTRYGLFDLLDNRSEYGQGAFPEPFLVDDSDLEPGEARLDWLHTEGADSRTDRGKAEIETAFGLMTLELEVPYERDQAAGATSSGFDNVDLGARYPLCQIVSPSGLVDATFGAGLEGGIPTESFLSKHPELVPKIFNDLKIGSFTLQSVLGYSTLFGQGGEGSLQAFEYGFMFGWTIPHRQLPLPDVLECIPFLEVLGETELNQEMAGHNALLGNAGFRFNLKSIGRVQPRPGIGFVFPMDSGGHEVAHWGVITSLVFQF